MNVERKLRRPSHKDSYKLLKTVENGGFSNDGRVMWTWTAGQVSLYRSPLPLFSPRKESYQLTPFQQVSTGGRQLVSQGKLLYKKREFLLLTFADSSGSLLLVISLVSGELVRVIQIPVHVSTVTGISHMTPPGLFVQSPLSLFSGVVACGCDQTGCVLLLDLALSHTRLCPHPNIRYPRPVKVVPFGSDDMMTGDAVHLALELNGHYIKRSKVYQYADENNQLIGSFDGVIVTTLHHVPLVCGILVGYNFGGFQLFSLLDSTLLYSLPLLVRRLPPPVTHFTIQEPEDDPRHFLYVWVARNGHQPQEMFGSSPSITMYQMGFKKKVVHSNETFYKEFEGCQRRFEVILWPWFNTSAVMVNCCTIEQVPHSERTYTKTPLSINSTLAVFICRGSEESNKSIVTVFDLNAWYNCQMPLHPSWTVVGQTGQEVCPFLVMHELSCDEGHVLDGVVCSMSPLASPHTKSNNLLEYLSIGSNFLSSNGVTAFQLAGTQTEVINELLIHGANVMGNPAHYISQLQCADLLSDGVSLGVEEEMQYSILSFCLQYCLYSILRDIAEASLVVGYHISPACLLTWINRTLDELVTEKINLISSSEGDISSSIVRQLSTLSQLVTTLSSSTDIQEDYIDALYHEIDIHRQLMETFDWCVENELLPHISDADTLLTDDSEGFVFPSVALEKRYDALLERRHYPGLAVNHLICELPQVEGVSFNYPPTNIRCLLKLVAYPSTLSQQLLILYTLLDVATPPGHPSLAMNYSITFKLDCFDLATLIWSIDHSATLPSLNDTRLFQFSAIFVLAVRSLLNQGNFLKAIEYLSQSGGKEPCMYVETLVSAGHVTKAAKVLEENEGSDDYTMLLEHFVNCCLTSPHSLQVVKLQLNDQQLDRICEVLCDIRTDRSIHLALSLLLHHRRNFEAVSLAREYREYGELAITLADSSLLHPSQESMCSADLLKRIQSTRGVPVGVPLQPFSSVLAKSCQRKFTSQVDTLVALTEATKLISDEGMASVSALTPFKKDHIPRRLLVPIPFVSSPRSVSRSGRSSRIVTPSATPTHKVTRGRMKMHQFVKHMEGFEARMAFLSAMDDTSKRDYHVIQTPVPDQHVDTPAPPTSILKPKLVDEEASPAVFTNRRIRFALEESPVDGVAIPTTHSDDSDSFFSLEGSPKEEIEVGMVQYERLESPPDYSNEVILSSKQGVKKKRERRKLLPLQPVNDDSSFVAEEEELSIPSVELKSLFKSPALLTRSSLQSVKGPLLHTPLRAVTPLSKGPLSSPLVTPLSKGLSLAPVLSLPKGTIKRTSTSKSTASKRKTNPIHSGVMVTTPLQPEEYHFSPPGTVAPPPGHVTSESQPLDTQVDYVFSPPLLRSASRARKAKELSRFGTGLDSDTPNRRSLTTPILQLQDKPLRTVKGSNRRRK